MPGESAVDMYSINRLDVQLLPWKHMFFSLPLPDIISYVINVTDVFTMPFVIVLLTDIFKTVALSS